MCIRASDNPGAGVLPEGSDDPDLRFDYDDEGYEIDAFAGDFAGDLTVPVPGEFSNGTVAIDGALTGKNAPNGHYLFLACRVRDETGYKLEIRPRAQVAAIWLLSPDGNQRIANVGLTGDPSSGPFRIELSCEGDQLTGRIDGEEIISVTDATYDQGSFAFGAGVYQLSAGPVSADFDNLTVSVPASDVSVTPDASPEPIGEPTEAATAAPTEAVAGAATAEVTEEATGEPTIAPTEEPTQEPTVAPTAQPTQEPTAEPTEAPVSQAAIFDRAGLAAAADQLRGQAEANSPIYGPQSGSTDLPAGDDLLDFVATTTSTALQRLKDAGTVRLGSLQMVEFAYGPTGHNPHYGAVHNPWNVDHITGGSSSGSGSAVAARLTFAALGSDTGGSIRQPASLCGVVGLRPTYGLVSRFGLVSLASSLDQIGPLTKDVEDAAIMLNVLAGHDSRDATSVAAELPDYRTFLGRDISGMRIGAVSYTHLTLPTIYSV